MPRLLRRLSPLRRQKPRFGGRMVIKGQALPDFIVEGTNLEDPSYQLENEDTEKEGDAPVWKLYVDGASNE